MYTLNVYFSMLLERCQTHSFNNVPCSFQDRASFFSSSIVIGAVLGLADGTNTAESMQKGRRASSSARRRSSSRFEFSLSATPVRLSISSRQSRPEQSLLSAVHDVRSPSSPQNTIIRYAESWKLFLSGWYPHSKWPYHSKEDLCTSS